MANQFINSMTDLWQSSGTAYSSIKMNVTNAASAGDGSTTDQTLMSKLIHMQVGSVDKFAVDKLGNIRTAGTIYGAGVISSGASSPSGNDTAALGISGTAWSDLFLASGGVINWNAADVTITHSTNALAFAGASSGYTFDATVSPLTNAGSALGTATVSWSNLFLAVGAALNYGNGNVVLTHSALALTVGPGDLRITTAGTNSASVVTVGGTQTLTGKTLTSPTITTPSISGPTITGSPTAVGATWVNLGAVTTADINGGTIDGTVIGATAAAAITGTTVSGTGATFSTVNATTSITSLTGTFSTKVIGTIVETSQIVQSSGTTIIIAPAAGLNTIKFRPRGQGDPAGEATLDSAGNLALSGTIGASDLPATAFTTDTNQTILNTADKVIITDADLGQVNASNFMLQSAVNGGWAMMTFHSPSSWASHFGMHPTNGNFYKGGWSWGAGKAYVFWDELNLPGGAAADLVNRTGTYKLFTGSALDIRMSQWRDDAVNTAYANVGNWYAANVGANVVGSVGFFNRISGTAAYGANDVIGGGGIGWANVATNVNGAPNAGAWRCLGYVQSGSTTTGSTTMWMRYA